MYKLIIKVFIHTQMCVSVDNWVQRSKTLVLVYHTLIPAHWRDLRGIATPPSIDHALSPQRCSGCYVCLVLSVVTVHLEWACPTNLLIGNIHRLQCLRWCTLTFVTEGYIWWVSPTGMCLCRTKQTVVVCVYKCLLLFVYTSACCCLCIQVML